MDATAARAVWQRRLTIASREVPAVAERRKAIDAVYRAAARSAWPRLQRVHGDLHLGQVLAVPGGGWRIVDFEGEPLRPMTERDAPDLPLRDVAGMLRSFSYAWGAALSRAPAEPPAERERLGPALEAWERDTRKAFVDAYAEAMEGGGLFASFDDMRGLARLAEIEKVLYELRYELDNRPAWVHIPLQGLAYLVEKPEGG